jgi:hypothetical protein
MAGHSPVSADDDPKSAAADRLKEMHGLCGEFTAFRLDKASRTRVELMPEPLHRWNDPTRDFSDGAVWVWGREGRPLAALAMELYPDRGRGPLGGPAQSTWSLELVALTAEKSSFEVKGSGRYDLSHSFGVLTSPDGTLTWKPEPAGLSFRVLPDAPTPAEGEADRLIQVKRLARRFAAQEYLERSKQTYALRLLPHPAHRYSDPANGIIDGAAFLIAHGTNPEILLLIEAAVPPGGKGPTFWRYAPARLSSAAPTLELDKTVVWTLPYAHATAETDSYFLPRRIPDEAGRSRATAPNVEPRK